MRVYSCRPITYRHIKGLLDWIAALALLLLTGWFTALCMLIIKLDDPKSRVIFEDERIGQNSRPFIMYKLRTMKAECTGQDAVLENTLTRPGKLLRKFSLDELPQLLNILSGEMSFIGPRPLPVRYISYFTTSENKRHEVRPGITGLAQVNGRANLAWEKRFAYDAIYVNSLSFLLDAKILISTFAKILGSDDVLVSKYSEVTESFDEHRVRQWREQENLSAEE